LSLEPAQRLLGWAGIRQHDVLQSTITINCMKIIADAGAIEQCIVCQTVN